MSGDVHETLNDLERKLRELQSELGTLPPAAGNAPPMPPYRAPAREDEPPPPPAAAQPAAPAPGGIQDQLDELLRFRDQLAAAAKALVEDYSRVLEQITRVVQPPAPAPAPPTPAAGHATFPVPPPTPASTESTLYSGQVAIDAGPFSDIGAVAAFEASLRQVPGAQDVGVRSFDSNRATVELQLASEVPLVFELRRASDQTFDVEQADGGRLVLTLHDPSNVPFPMRP